MKYAALFPGQGCQYKKMCESLYQSDGDFRGIINKASDILGYDLWDMICNSKMSVFTKSENAQPAVTTVTYALYRNFLKLCSDLPSIAFGHSLGEISAIICAESISFEDGISFIQKRGKLMSEISEKKLGFCGIAIDITQEHLVEIINTISTSHYVAITGYNSTNQFMIGGEYGAESLLDDCVSKCGGQYIPYKMIPMKVNAPYHSRLMEEFKPMIHKMLESISFHKPVFPIISTVSGKLIKESSEISGLLEEQLVNPVLWNQTITLLKDMNLDAVIDIGPGKIMKNLVLETYSMPNIFTLDNNDERTILKNKLKAEGGHYE